MAKALMLLNRQRLLPLFFVVVAVAIIGTALILNMRESTYTWLPTGDWIAFSCTPAGEIDKSGIYLVRADGSALQRVTPDENVAHSPSWAPSGERLAFVNDKRLYVLDLANLKMGPILDTDYGFLDSDSSPAWSPNGEWIAFISYRASIDQWELYKVKSDGNDLTRLTLGMNVHGSLAWTSDGQSIVFISAQAEDASHIYMVDNDGSNLLRVTSQRAVYDPTISPDGEWIAFSMSDQTGINLYRLRIDGSDMQQLTNVRGRTTHPEWSKDMNRIAYSSMLEDLHQIFILDVENNTSRQVTAVDCNAMAPEMFTY